MSVVLGLDIGGANLKAATSTGWACSVPFPLWAEPQNLSAGIGELILRARNVTPASVMTELAVTMTGELADCYPDRKTGVAEILAAVQTAVAAVFSSHPPVVRIWQTSGRFASPERAAEQWLETAAANWHALATFVGMKREFLFGSSQGTISVHNTAVASSPSMATCAATAGILLDIGSTTCDIIPIAASGQPVTQGQTDLQRLQAGELVYTGIRRTPIMALLHELRRDKGAIPLAAERFATIWDAWLLLGLVPEDPDDTDTADGRSSTKLASFRRLARMLCTDSAECSQSLAQDFATQCAAAQLRQIATAANRCISTAIASGNRPGWVCLSGSGSLIARVLLGYNTGSETAPIDRTEIDRLVFPHRNDLPVEIETLRNHLSKRTCVSLADALSPPIADAACAYAVATLASAQHK